jgi:hypothetical protein
VHCQNPTSRHRSRGEEAGGSTVKQHLEPNCDACDTIEAHRRAAGDDGYDYGYGDNRDHRDECRPHRRDDQRRGGRYDSDDYRDRSWSPNQRGPHAFR